MDTLALLCNLHADGPDSLQRLRSAGLDSPAELEEVDAGELSRVLEVSLARARRFQREAQQLAERLGELLPSADEADGEEAAAPASPAPSPAPESTAPSPAPESTAPHPTPEPPAPRPAARPAPETPPTARASAAPPAGGGTHPSPIDSVLASWRERDADAPPAPAPSGRGTLVPRSAPEAPGRRSGRGLAPAALDGLDEAACSALCSAGITSLGALAETRVLDLVSRTGLPFTHLRRLQFLAQRELDAAAEPEGPGDGPSDDAGDDAGPAGPFA